MPPSRLEVGFALTLILLLAVVLAIVLRPRSTPHEGALPPCTTTITATSGSVQGWLASAQPGQVLCLSPGVYTGGGNMLSIASGQGGTETQPLWIRAQEEGTVLLDGQFGGRPIDCAGHDVILHGVNARDGNDSVVVLRGTRCQARRIVAWSTAATWGVDNVVDFGGTNNTLEDGAAFGYARKMVAAGARAGRSGNVIRRVWLEHNGFIPSPGSDPGNPTNPLEVGYDMDLVTAENVIVRRNILSSATQPEAPLSIFSTWDSWIGGAIVYLHPGDTMDTTSLGSFFPEGGSHEGSGHATSRTTLTHSVFYAPPSFPSVGAFWMSGSSQGSGNVMDRVVAVSPNVSTCGATGWSCREVKTGTTMQQALGSQSVWDVVPGICRQYKNRQLTETPLWSWDMDKRISDALVLAGRPPFSVTASIEAALGPIPAACRTGSQPPIPPEPGPSPVALTCTGDVLAQGKLTMQCVPQTRRR